jgi:hypothetical protein
METEDNNGYTSPPEKIIQDSPIKRRGSSIKVCFVNKCYSVVYSFYMYLENQRFDRTSWRQHKWD